VASRISRTEIRLDFEKEASRGKEFAKMFFAHLSSQKQAVAPLPIIHLDMLR
jgi:hypothetical protein